MTNEPLKVGLIGGGGQAFIVHPHQRAIHMDGTRRVVCGALFPDPEQAMRQAREWPYPLRGYGSYEELIRAEAALPVGERVDYVLIVTPNHLHFDPALKCIQAGLPVFCEKPLTMDLEQADTLVAAVKKSGVPFAVAHTYLGHWTTHLARHIVRSGLLGEVRWADSSYLQGWLAARTEDENPQARWRVDPKCAGASCCGGDIGTHALMQLRFITGLEPTAVSAHMDAIVPGRQLDDHFVANLRLSNGARAMVRASQIAIGHLNDMAIEINGSKGSLMWRQEDPEQLRVMLPGRPDRVYWRGAVQPDEFLGELPQWLIDEGQRLPSGHTEGFHDAMARLHRFFERDIRAWRDGGKPSTDTPPYATVEDGRAGIAFIAASVQSHRNDNQWVSCA